MHRLTVARAFVVFHFTLGTVVLLQSAQSAFGAAGLGSTASPRWHMLAVAATAHALRGELPGALLVYAAGTAFVIVHGPA